MIDLRSAHIVRAEGHRDGWAVCDRVCAVNKVPRLIGRVDEDGPRRALLCNELGDRRLEVHFAEVLFARNVIEVVEFRLGVGIGSDGGRYRVLGVEFVDVRVEQILDDLADLLPVGLRPEAVRVAFLAVVDPLREIVRAGVVDNDHVAREPSCVDTPDAVPLVARIADALDLVDAATEADL